MAAMEKPIMFIQEKNGKFTINDEAVRLLKTIEEPAVVVAVVGKYRTGKSFLMNRLYGRSSGFSLGSTVQSQTKGFWLWCRPHPVYPDKRLILIDTEGLCDVEKGDRTYDTKLFSLALLLCSCLVYNSMGTIDNEALQQLHFVTKLTKHIKISPEKEEVGNDYDKYFPPFYWVVRDFILELEIDGEPCKSEDEYLEHALKPKRGHGTDVEDFNRPRQYIRDFFPKRKCFVLCKPVDDDEKIKRIENLADKELKPAFLTKANEVCQTILEEAGPFKVGGTPINGPRLLILAERYVEAINSGAVPCIGTAVETMRDSECQKAVEKGLETYKCEMDSRVRHKLPMNPKDLSHENMTVQTMALQIYSAAALFDGTGTYQEKLQKSLIEHFRSYVQSNEEKSRERCRQILRECYESVQMKLQEGQYTGKGCYKVYKQDYDQVIRKYQETENKGPCAQEILQEFISSKESEGMTIMANDKAMARKDKKVAKLEEKERKAEQARKASDEEARRLKRELADNEESNLIMMRQVQDDFDQKLKQVQQDNQEALKGREKEYQRLLDEGQKRQAELYEEAVEELRRDKEALEKLRQERTAKMQESIRRQEKLVEEIHSNPPGQKNEGGVWTSAGEFVGGLISGLLGTGILKKFFT